MTVDSGFYDSVDSDRLYSADDFSKPFSLMVRPGIFASEGNQLRVLAESSASMRVRVLDGAAFYGGRWVKHTGTTYLNIGAPDALPRIDRVVLRIDKRAAERRAYFYVIRGTAASTPLAPNPVNGPEMFDMSIAFVRVDPKVTVINDAAITYLGGSAGTPWVTAPMETMDMSFLTQKYEQQWNSWFTEVKGNLSGDVAGALSARLTTAEGKITQYGNSIDTLEHSVSELTSDSGWVDVTVSNEWTSTGFVKARVRNGQLWFTGTFQRTTAITVSQTTDVIVAPWPSTIKTYLSNSGWSNNRIAMGSAVSVSGTSAVLLADNANLYIGYRTKQPVVSEWVRGSITAGLPA